MNKREAKHNSTADAYSILALRSLIAEARDQGGMSKVNPAISLAQACDVYMAALAGRDDAEVPRGYHYDVYKRRNVPSRDSMIIRNILRDCA